MKSFFLFSIAAVFSCFVFAQDNVNVEEKKDGEKDVRSEHVTAVKIAQNLANYGYAHKDALSMLNAAQILVRNAPQKMNPDKVEDGEKVASEKTETKTADLLKPLTLIADARTMTENENLLAIADLVEKDIKSTASQSARGVADGARATYKTVSGGSYVYYLVTFYEGSLVEVAIVGDGNTDLDIYIYDEDGNLITKDTSQGDNCYASWKPK